MAYRLRQGTCRCTAVPEWTVRVQYSWHMRYNAPSRGPEARVGQGDAGMGRSRRVAQGAGGGGGVVSIESGALVAAEAGCAGEFLFVRGSALGGGGGCGTALERALLALGVKGRCRRLHFGGCVAMS